MYKIGEFSKLVNLSIKTLRYYDEIGLLKPDYKDEFSGYRYYTSTQTSIINKIKLLQEASFKLSEIKDIIDNNPNHVYSRKAQELIDLNRKRINALEKLREMENSSKNLSDIEKVNIYSVYVRKESVEEALKLIDDNLKKFNINSQDYPIFECESPHKGIFIVGRVIKDEEKIKKLEETNELDDELDKGYLFSMCDYLVKSSDAKDETEAFNKICEIASNFDIYLLGGMSKIIDKENIVYFMEARDKYDVYKNEEKFYSHLDEKEKEELPDLIVGRWKIEGICDRYFDLETYDKNVDDIDIRVREFSVLKNGKTSVDGVSVVNKYLKIEKDGARRYYLCYLKKDGKYLIVDYSNVDDIFLHNYILYKRVD